MSAYEKYRVQFEKLQNTLTNTATGSPTRSPSPSRDSGGRGSPSSSSPPNLKASTSFNPLTSSPVGTPRSLSKNKSFSRSSSAVLTEAEEDARQSMRSVELMDQGVETKKQRKLRMGRSKSSFSSASTRHSLTSEMASQLHKSGE